MAAVVVALVIYAGSRGLRYFDAALVGYATATVFLAFGVTYRYAVWVSSPPARRYLKRGWQAFFSWRNFRRLPTAVPRAVLGYLGLQSFLRARGRGPAWCSPPGASAAPPRPAPPHGPAEPRHEWRVAARSAATASGRKLPSPSPASHHPTGGGNPRPAPPPRG